MPRLGAAAHSGGVRFRVSSRTAERVWVCLFDARGERETERLEMSPAEGGCFALDVRGVAPGTRYGLRADGEFAPERGLWFDPKKLLVDPYAVEIDRPFAWDARLSSAPGHGPDTAPLVPKAIVRPAPEPLARRAPGLKPGGTIYEAPVRALTMRHPAIPSALRGRVAALAHPVILDHLLKLKVDAVELMPVAAWIDERHLPPLGLSNAWGYNPVCFMALDPRLAPGALAELRAAADSLHSAGIDLLLDVVFNHTGESDRFGPTLSMRGLDNLTYYRHASGDPGQLVNDTGTGNTIACNDPAVSELILDAMRHFVLGAGVDGFRFDLATALGRSGEGGFDPAAPLLRAMRQDPVLGDRILIAEPWDLGQDGYQLGRFPSPFLEWNDRFRDDARCFWRGDAGTLPALATRLAGSSDVFRRGGLETTRSVNFIAAHDGMTLRDLSSYRHKHNELNGEDNRDGHGENFSWNNGVEGDSADAGVLERRARDSRALLATLFASRGTLLISAGDEFGRTQRGNNNAYAQDNELTWLDWEGRDLDLETSVAALARFRADWGAKSGAAARFLDGAPISEGNPPDVEWRHENGHPLTALDWEQPDRRRLVMLSAFSAAEGRIGVLVNGEAWGSLFTLPSREGFSWREVLWCEPRERGRSDAAFFVEGRSVAYLVEQPELREAPE